ncbi:hypothetical protein NEOLEDRAFT_1056025 [Neolentinus lepideus HHB14362 ss-1]|uniref:Zn(2)-C6 fungal-type domain-containing protein n=1 Tax=Neolentinus lepideus HHB14362 ss-1 TaxID=1314782 RepID=A0A165VP74_9AGAM|nr:hypothetical protein NEOLEDRAFT_1056025 [Neolentinus lepideus HHB14362 ss-1]
MPPDIHQRRSGISSPARSSKKVGAPKAKGAVRAKSGCYTCRIRRKKCDERQDPNGNCETCVRLRLQCLGFGAKRPDYLKDTKNVADFREKIKSFLASNGMIKGHSNPGTRAQDEEPSILRLVDERRYSSASSPSSESITSDAHDGYRSHLITSHVRDPEPHYELSMPNDPPYSHHGHNDPTPVPTSYPSYPSLAMQSSYGTLYHHQVVYEEAFEVDDLNPSGSSPPVPSPSMVMPAYHYGTPDDDLVYYYFQHVVRQQYLLAEETVFHDISNMVRRSPSALNAACFLSALHKQRGMVSDTLFFSNVKKALSRPGHEHTEDDIMAGLIVISSFLFKGGRGSWKEFLDVARLWVLNYFSRFRSPVEGLKNSQPNIRFVIKTTMWFDVLASITELQPPQLLSVYRDIWGRFGDGYTDADPDLSMLRPMGCDNETFLALAEVSNLAWWKDNQQKYNRLSVIELIGNGRQIEDKYLRRNAPPPAGTKAHDPHRLTSNIFRASARLYLHSILAGDYPACKEISEAVDDTVRCLKAIPTDGNLRRSIVRSVVFSICICGCLTDDAEHRHYLLERLREQERVSDIGNCGAVKSVMQTVWDRRDAMLRQWESVRGGAKAQPPPVNWREVMQESNQGLLLLV